MTLHATILKSASVTDLDTKKKYPILVAKLKRRLKEPDVGQEERDEIKEFLSLQEEGVHVVDANHSSVKLLVWCSQLSSLKRFHEWLNDGTMRNIAETVFNRLLETSLDNRLHVEIEWNEDIYKELVSYLQRWTGT
jgi:hypothetical protein